MEQLENNQAINQEIQRLSLRIALARYELWEAVIQGTPLGFCHHLTQEISICMLQRSALRDGRFHELPYPIRHLYKSN
jgi:hypothetical protein